jgi:hypothetical protein
MIVYGSSIADGHEHAEKNLPILVAGGGSGSLQTGRFHDFRRDTSMSRLHLSMMQKMGMATTRFADADEGLVL